MMPDKHERYMIEAIELSKKGIGSVEPNPPVGCLIVKDGKVIGRGYHKKFGAAHAEVNAIADCIANGFETTGADMYVTLEPCCHIGKTGPCSEEIIKARIARVFIGTVDPSDHASCKGMARLQAAGIEVVAGICTQQSQIVMAPFMKFIKCRTPWVIIKWAQSADAVIGFKSHADDRWISNKTSRADVHKLRRRVQGILIGINTVLSDDPLLTPRPDGGKRPLRVVLDSHLRIPLNCRLLNTPDFPTLIMTTAKTLEQKTDLAEEITAKGPQVIAVDETNGRCGLKDVLAKLGQKGVQQLLVEGGAKVITSFINESLADEVRVYICPKNLNSDNAIKTTIQMRPLTNPAELLYSVIRQLDDDKCISGLLKHTDEG